MKKMVRSQAEAKYNKLIVEAAIELAGWTPEPEPVAEKTPWDILDEVFHAIGGYSRRGDGGLFDDIEKTAATAGLKLIKASDEVVKVEEELAARRFFYTRLQYDDAWRIIHELEVSGYVIAKRAGS